MSMPSLILMRFMVPGFPRHRKGLAAPIRQIWIIPID
jgi:hypothetical protein